MFNWLNIIQVLIIAVVVYAFYTSFIKNTSSEKLVRGLFGLGFGKSRQKYLYLPFQYNDYIFAIICEELGLVGAVLIVALFALTILRGYWIALKARDRFSTVLAAGLVTLIAVQTILNLCVVTNLLPSTGIALPFFSYGGTALAVNLGEMGVVLSISRHRNQTKIQEVSL